MNTVNQFFSNSEIKIKCNNCCKITSNYTLGRNKVLCVQIAKVSGLMLSALPNHFSRNTPTKQESDALHNIFVELSNSENFIINCNIDSNLKDLYPNIEIGDIYYAPSFDNSNSIIINEDENMYTNVADMIKSTIRDRSKDISTLTMQKYEIHMYNIYDLNIVNAIRKYDIIDSDKVIKPTNIIV